MLHVSGLLPLPPAGLISFRGLLLSNACLSQVSRDGACNLCQPAVSASITSLILMYIQSHLLICSVSISRKFSPPLCEHLLPPLVSCDVNVVHVCHSDACVSVFNSHPMMERVVILQHCEPLFSQKERIHLFPNASHALGLLCLYFLLFFSKSCLFKACKTELCQH